MDQHQSDKFSKLLDTEEQRVRRELDDVAVKDPISGGFQPKPADYEGDVREEDIAREQTATETKTALEQELKHHLVAILNAREKLKTGRYGLCEICGEAIPEKRLEALPATPYCVRHAV